MIKFFVFAVLGLALTGCASGRFKERQAQRDKVAATSGMFCEFVSGDEHPDVDVEMNLRMAQKCDSNKPFSITGYKNSSENFGVVYCCSMVKNEPKPKVTERREKPEATAADSVNSSAPKAAPTSPAAGDAKKAAPKVDDNSDLDN